MCVKGGGDTNMAMNMNISCGVRERNGSKVEWQQGCPPSPVPPPPLFPPLSLSPLSPSRFHPLSPALSLSYSAPGMEERRTPLYTIEGGAPLPFTSLAVGLLQVLHLDIGYRIVCVCVCVCVRARACVFCESVSVRVCVLCV